jgi:hypothetical protein
VPENVASADMAMTHAMLPSWAHGLTVGRGTGSGMPLNSGMLLNLSLIKREISLKQPPMVVVLFFGAMDRKSLASE